MATPPIRVDVDQKALDRAMKRLERYQGKPLQRRAQQVYVEGARLMRGPMQRAAPVKTGALRRAITARGNRLRPGEMAVASVGPRHRKAPHRYLVTEGTRRHALTGVRSGARFARFPSGQVRAFVGFDHPGARANPFVERTREAHAPRIQSWINARVIDLGETFRVSSF
jgi:hypothetical protein